MAPGCRTHTLQGAAVAETIRLVAINSAGTELELEIAAIAGEDSVLTVCGFEPEPQTFRGNNLFVCLMDLRLNLEAEGYLLCCNGARPDVFPSGTLQQTTHGRHAYVLSRGRELSDDDIVDILGPAPRSQVVTVEAQREAVLSFFKIDLARPDRNSE